MSVLSLSVQYAVNEQERLPRWRLRRWVLRAATLAFAMNPALGSRLELTLRLVDNAEGRELNQAFRGRDYATNVLTFEYGLGPDGVCRADVILCIPVLSQEAREQKKTFLDHAAHLTIHGVLHALGYDHIKVRDAKTMESLEIKILQTLSIANPYE